VPDAIPFRSDYPALVTNAYKAIPENLRNYVAAKSEPAPDSMRRNADRPALSHNFFKELTSLSHRFRAFPRAVLAQLAPLRKILRRSSAIKDLKENTAYFTRPLR